MIREYRMRVVLASLAFVVLGACGPGSTGPDDPTTVQIPLPMDTIVTNNGASIRPPIGAAALTVSDLGDAHYHVPLWVPPGRNGMQPDLALDYSSSAGNGAE